MNSTMRTNLWHLSFNKELFKKELIRIHAMLDEEEQFELFQYCYEKYSDIYPDVLIEVFYTQSSQFH